MSRKAPSLAGIVLMVSLLVLCSLVSLGLLWLRMERSGSQELVFLRWNLLLAWTPLLLALLTMATYRLSFHPLLQAAAASLWLLFLPNAPYLVTDLIHLGRLWENVPLWYDVVLLSAFGGTGLLIGYGSLFLMQSLISERFGNAAGWAASGSVVILSSVGVYAGRVFRLNSWDAITHPGVIASLVRQRLQDPLGDPHFMTLVLVMAILLLLGYIVFVGSAATAGRLATPRQRSRNIIARR